MHGVAPAQSLQGQRVWDDDVPLCIGKLGLSDPPGSSFVLGKSIRRCLGQSPTSLPTQEWQSEVQGDPSPGDLVGQMLLACSLRTSKQLRGHGQSSC